MCCGMNVCNWKQKSVFMCSEGEAWRAGGPHFWGLMLSWELCFLGEPNSGQSMPCLTFTLPTCPPPSPAWSREERIPVGPREWKVEKACGRDCWVALRDPAVLRVMGHGSGLGMFILIREGRWIHGYVHCQNL